MFYNDEAKASFIPDEFVKAWKVLLASFVGIGIGVSSLSYYAAGIFMTPIEQEFGWSRAMISAQSIFGVAILAVLSPFIGVIIDKIGIRRVAFLSLAAYALGFYATSFLPNSIVVFYVITIATTVFAAGSSPVTFTRAITGWFDNYRGIALGMALMSTGVAGILAPMYLTEYVADNGWRSGYKVLALVVAAGAVVVLLFLRDDPNSIKRAKALKQPLNPSAPVSRLRLFTDPVFRQLAVIFILVSMAVSGVIVHFIPMLIDSGIAPADAGRLASVIGISVIVGRIVTGILIDRYFAPKVAAVLFSLAALGFLTFLFAGMELAIIAGIAVGFAMGAEVDLIGFLVSRYFKMQFYGVVYGTLYGVFLLGAGLAPFFSGVVYDLASTYQPALIASVVSLAIAAVLCLRLPAFPNLNDQELK